MNSNIINSYRSLANCSLTSYMPVDWPGFLKWCSGYLTGGRSLLSRTDIELQDFEILENNYQNILLCSKGIETSKKLLKALYDLRLDLINGDQGSHSLPELLKELSDTIEKLKDAMGSFLKLEKEFTAKFKAIPRISQADLDALGVVPKPKTKPDYENEQAVIDDARCVAGEVLADWTKGAHDAMTFRYRELGEDHWHNAGAAISSPGHLDISMDAKPRIIEISGRYIKSNKAVGEWSIPLQITVKAA